MIKLKTLREGDYLRLAGGLQDNHQGPDKRLKESGESEKGLKTR